MRREIIILKICDYGIPGVAKKITIKRYRSEEKAINICNSMPKARYYCEVIVNGETIHET